VGNGRLLRLGEVGCEGMPTVLVGEGEDKEIDERRNDEGGGALKSVVGRGERWERVGDMEGWFVIVTGENGIGDLGGGGMDSGRPLGVGRGLPEELFEMGD
jgi:hypothetical protein